MPAFTIPGELTKGRYFSVAELTAIIGFNPDADEDAFKLATLRLKGQIEKASPVVARSMDGGLSILTDVQASDYTHKRFGNGVKRLRRLRDVMQFRVDPQNMAAMEIAQHGQRLQVDQSVVGAIDTVLSPVTVKIKPQQEARA